MALLCHYGLERWMGEGQERMVFSRFSEALSYPMGINIVYYALTH